MFNKENSKKLVLYLALLPLVISGYFGIIYFLFNLIPNIPPFTSIMLPFLITVFVSALSFGLLYYSGKPSSYYLPEDI